MTVVNCIYQYLKAKDAPASLQELQEHLLKKRNRPIKNRTIAVLCSFNKKLFQKTSRRGIWGLTEWDFAKFKDFPFYPTTLSLVAGFLLKQGPSHINDICEGVKLLKEKFSHSKDFKGNIKSTLSRNKDVFCKTGYAGVWSLVGLTGGRSSVRP